MDTIGSNWSSHKLYNSFYLLPKDFLKDAVLFWVLRKASRKFRDKTVPSHHSYRPTQHFAWKPVFINFRSGFGRLRLFNLIPLRSFLNQVPQLRMLDVSLTLSTVYLFLRKHHTKGPFKQLTSQDESIVKKGCCYLITLLHS